jgi:hypothetical protein
MLYSLMILRLLTPRTGYVREYPRLCQGVHHATVRVVLMVQ